MSAGLAKLGHVAIDGTKMKANASKHNAMSHERMVKEEVRLKAEVDQLIVLLLLYLVLDQHDKRPLVIDQPEENLDPKSVFDELVPDFRAARARRQVIVVTHNANLVVNTDADQILVATEKHETPGQRRGPVSPRSPVLPSALRHGTWKPARPHRAPGVGVPRCRRRVAVRPYRAALASWSLLRSLLFRGAVKRLDTP